MSGMMALVAQAEQQKQAEDLSIVTITVDETTQQRMQSCAAYMPYSARPYSCTETTMRTLGMITEETFQRAARAHHAGQLGPTNTKVVESSMSQIANIPIVLTEYTLDYICSNIDPNDATLLCATWGVNSGHTMIIAKRQDNIPVLIDASADQSATGKDAIRAHLAGYDKLFVPTARTADQSSLRFSRIGGMNPQGRQLLLAPRLRANSALSA